MDITQKALIEALKASLFGTTPEYPDNMDRDDVIREAKEQTVMGLISPVMPSADESIGHIKATYMRILHEQDKLIKLLDKHNIPCVILKGSAAAIYYPKPYLRTMGDIDFLVPRDLFYEAAELLENNGYIYKHGKDDNGKLLDNTRHIEYMKNDIEFELHHHFSSPGFDIDDLLEDALYRRESRELNGYKVTVLPDIENGLVLLGHINQHLKVNNLGLRQIIDWEMYVHRVMNAGTWKEFSGAAREAGLYKLAVNVTKMCKLYLGLPNDITWNNRVDDELTEELLNVLFKDGNFGRKSFTESPKYGGRIRRAVYNIKTKGLFRYFQTVGKGNWKLCKKYSFLEPFAWIYGILRCIGKGTMAVIRTRNVKGQISEGNQRFSLFRSIGIRTGDKN